MTDIPWAWTEREREGAIDFDSFGKDWIADVCAAGLKLFVVISMSEFPPWVTHDRFGESLSERVSPHASCQHADKPWSPSIANATSAALIGRFFDAAVAHLVAKHGSCLAAISPTLNNELETRYTQTHGCSRDYSPAVVDEFRRWQLWNHDSSIRGAGGVAVAPPALESGAVCDARKDVAWHAWLMFREELIARHYERLCASVQAAGALLPALRRVFRDDRPAQLQPLLRARRVGRCR